MKIDANKKLIYELFMAILAIIAVVLAIIDIIDVTTISTHIFFYYTDAAILAIFWVDYIYNFIKAPEKKTFVKNNIFDLIAIIPFSSLFRIFRIGRIFRIARVTRFLKIARLLKFSFFFKRIEKTFEEFFKTNSFGYMILITVFILFLSSLSIYIFEDGSSIETYGDALWFSIVTMTTVGYGDIYPVTIAGRIVASLLMVFGIGLIGFVTSTMAQFIINRKKLNTNQTKDPSQVLDLTELSKEDFNLVKNFSEYLKNKE